MENLYKSLLEKRKKEEVKIKNLQDKYSHQQHKMEDDLAEALYGKGVKAYFVTDKTDIHDKGKIVKIPPKETKKKTVDDQVLTLDEDIFIKKWKIDHPTQGVIVTNNPALRDKYKDRIIDSGVKISKKVREALESGELDIESFLENIFPKKKIDYEVVRDEEGMPTAMYEINKTDATVRKIPLTRLKDMIDERLNNTAKGIK
jgi:hypothetical protein